MGNKQFLLIAAFMGLLGDNQLISGLGDAPIDQSQFPPNPSTTIPRLDDIDLNGMVSRFSTLLTFKTVSEVSGQWDSVSLKQLINYLEAAYPLVHNTSWINRYIVNDTLSLVYIVNSASDEMAGTYVQRPWLIQTHSDVVPVSDRDLPSWLAPPFEGRVLYHPPDDQERSRRELINIANGLVKLWKPKDPTNSDYYLYGRGAMDAKHILVGVMEVLEYAVAHGLKPANRSFVFCLNHDEEVGGVFGAKKVVKFLQDVFGSFFPNQKPFEFSIDEGLTILRDLLPQSQKIAVVSVTEKYIMNLQLSVAVEGGHSSFPLRENSISILTNAVGRIQNHTFPSFFGVPGTPDLELLRRISHLFPKRLKKLVASKKFKGDFINKKNLPNLIMDNEMVSAFIRTTGAVTIFNGGIKSNVIPSYADANINLRVHPLHASKDVLEEVKRIIADDRVNIYVADHHVASPISDYEARGFKVIEETIKELFNETIVVPAIMIAGTDSKHLINITDNSYRFAPIIYGVSDIPRVHGVNERISVSGMEDLVNFYFRLILKTSGFTYEPAKPNVEVSVSPKAEFMAAESEYENIF